MGICQVEGLAGRGEVGSGFPRQKERATRLRKCKIPGGEVVGKTWQAGRSQAWAWCPSYLYGGGSFSVSFAGPLSVAVPQVLVFPGALSRMPVSLSISTPKELLHLWGLTYNLLICGAHLYVPSQTLPPLTPHSSPYRCLGTLWRDPLKDSWWRVTWYSK